MTRKTSKTKNPRNLERRVNGNTGKTLQGSVNICLSVCLSLYLCLSVCLSLSLSVCLSLFLSVSLSISVCLSLSLSLCVCLSLSLSLSLHISILLLLLLLSSKTSFIYCIQLKNIYHSLCNGNCGAMAEIRNSLIIHQSRSIVN